MMATGRRVFMKRVGISLAAIVAPPLATKAGESSSASDAHDFEPFVEVNGQQILGEKALSRKGLQLKVEERPYPGGRRYDLSLINSSTSPQRIDRVGLIFGAPSGGSECDWRVFLDVGSSGFCGVKRLDALDHDPRLDPVRPKGAGPFHRSDLQALMWDAKSGEGFLLGFLRQRYGHNKIDVIPSHNVSRIDRVEAWQELRFEVPPEHVQPLDPLVRAQGRDPYGLLEQFGSAVRDYQGRKFDAPPIVGMMTWYGYRTAIDEELVLANARIIAELFGGYPQKMQNLMLCDHGWQQEANWGYWEPDPKRFPHGMKWLAEQLAKEGVDLGIWYTPFCMTENAPNYKDLIPLQALNEDGKPRESKAAVWGDLPGQASTWPIRFFDGAKEEVQKMWAETLSRMKDWGVVYWKLDFFSLQTSAVNGRKLGVGELYARTWKTFRDAVGDGKLNPCSCPTNLQLGYNDSVRIAADIGDAGQWPGAMNSYRFGMGTVIGSWYKNRKFWVNDPDSIQFARGCSLNEARVRATAVAFSGGHLMLSEDLREVDRERLEMIRRLIPPYPQAARPLDLFENPFPEGYPALWALSLQTGFGAMTALAVFNLTSRTQSYDITPKMLGIHRWAGIPGD